MPDVWSCLPCVICSCLVDLWSCLHMVMLTHRYAYAYVALCLCLRSVSVHDLFSRPNEPFTFCSLFVPVPFCSALFTVCSLSVHGLFSLCSPFVLFGGGVGVAAPPANGRGGGICIMHTQHTRPKITLNPTTSIPPTSIAFSV